FRADRRQGVRRSARCRQDSSARSDEAARMTAASLRYNLILAEERRAGLRYAGLVGVIVVVCLAALGLTGFFDAQRFAEGGPALAQLASEMVPPDFGRWREGVKPLLANLAMSWGG